MKNIFLNIIESFNNKQNVGFSARKLTAFSFMLLIVYLHCRFINTDNLIEALLIDCGTLLMLLGIITMEQVIKFKNGGEEEKKDE